MSHARVTALDLDGVLEDLLPLLAHATPSARTPWTNRVRSLVAFSGGSAESGQSYSAATGSGAIGGPAGHLKTQSRLRRNSDTRLRDGEGSRVPAESALVGSRSLVDVSNALRDTMSQPTEAMGVVHARGGSRTDRGFYVLTSANDGLARLRNEGAVQTSRSEGSHLLSGHFNDSALMLNSHVGVGCSSGKIGWSPPLYTFNLRPVFGGSNGSAPATAVDSERLGSSGDITSASLNRLKEDRLAQAASGCVSARAGDAITDSSAAVTRKAQSSAGICAFPPDWHVVVSPAASASSSSSTRWTRGRRRSMIHIYSSSSQTTTLLRGEGSAAAAAVISNVSPLPPRSDQQPTGLGLLSNSMPPGHSVEVDARHSESAVEQSGDSVEINARHHSERASGQSQSAAGQSGGSTPPCSIDGVDGSASAHSSWSQLQLRRDADGSEGGTGRVTPSSSSANSSWSSTRDAKPFAEEHFSSSGDNSGEPSREQQQPASADSAALLRPSSDASQVEVSLPLCQFPQRAVDVVYASHEGRVEAAAAASPSQLQLHATSHSPLAPPPSNPSQLQLPHTSIDGHGMTKPTEAGCDTDVVPPAPTPANSLGSSGLGPGYGSSGLGLSAPSASPVDIALVALLRIVARFQALFDEEGDGCQLQLRAGDGPRSTAGASTTAADQRQQQGGSSSMQLPSADSDFRSLLKRFDLLSQSGSSSSSSSPACRSASATSATSAIHSGESSISTSATAAIHSSCESSTTTSATVDTSVSRKERNDLARGVSSNSASVSLKERNELTRGVSFISSAGSGAAQQPPPPQHQQQVEVDAQKQHQQQQQQWRRPEMPPACSTSTSSQLPRAESPPTDSSRSRLQQLRAVTHSPATLQLQQQQRPFSPNIGSSSSSSSSENEERHTLYPSSSENEESFTSGRRYVASSSSSSSSSSIVVSLSRHDVDVMTLMVETLATEWTYALMHATAASTSSCGGGGGGADTQSSTAAAGWTNFNFGSGGDYSASAATATSTAPETFAPQHDGHPLSTSSSALQHDGHPTATSAAPWHQQQKQQEWHGSAGLLATQSTSDSVPSSSNDNTSAASSGSMIAAYALPPMMTSEQVQLRSSTTGADGASELLQLRRGETTGSSDTMHLSLLQIGSEFQLGAPPNHHHYPNFNLKIVGDRPASTISVINDAATDASASVNCADPPVMQRNRAGSLPNNFNPPGSGGRNNFNLKPPISSGRLLSATTAKVSGISAAAAAATAAAGQLQLMSGAATSIPARTAGLSSHRNVNSLPAASSSRQNSTGGDGNPPRKPHRSRQRTKEQLAQKFADNPLIFDATTRDYISALVSPTAFSGRSRGASSSGAHGGGSSEAVGKARARLIGEKAAAMVALSKLKLAAPHTLPPPADAHSSKLKLATSLPSHSVTPAATPVPPSRTAPSYFHSPHSSMSMAHSSTSVAEGASDVGVSTGCTTQRGAVGTGSGSETDAAGGIPPLHSHANAGEAASHPPRQTLPSTVVVSHAQNSTLAQFEQSAPVRARSRTPTATSHGDTSQVEVGPMVSGGSSAAQSPLSTVAPSCGDSLGATSVAVTTSRAPRSSTSGESVGDVAMTMTSLATAIMEPQRRHEQQQQQQQQQSLAHNADAFAFDATSYNTGVAPTSIDMAAAESTGMGTPDTPTPVSTDNTPLSTYSNNSSGGGMTPPGSAWERTPQVEVFLAAAPIAASNATSTSPTSTFVAATAAAAAAASTSTVAAVAAAAQLVELDMAELATMDELTEADIQAVTEDDARVPRVTFNLNLTANVLEGMELWSFDVNAACTLLVDESASDATASSSDNATVRRSGPTSTMMGSSSDMIRGDGAVTPPLPDTIDSGDDASALPLPLQRTAGRRGDGSTSTAIPRTFMVLKSPPPVSVVPSEATATTTTISRLPPVSVVCSPIWVEGSSALLTLVSINALERLGVIDDLRLHRPTLLRFFSRIARGYGPLPYHGALHAADVTQALYSTMTSGGLARKMPPELRLAAVLAAACHDVGHPGLNNAYLTASDHPLALTYNDHAPLEQMHAATAFLTMRSVGCDVLAPLSRPLKTTVRRLVVEAILSTDNSRHFNLVSRLKRRIARALKPSAVGAAGVTAIGSAFGGRTSTWATPQSVLKTSTSMTAGVDVTTPRAMPPVTPGFRLLIRPPVSTGLGNATGTDSSGSSSGGASSSSDSVSNAEKEEEEAEEEDDDDDDEEEDGGDDGNDDGIAEVGASSAAAAAVAADSHPSGSAAAATAGGGTVTTPAFGWGGDSPSTVPVASARVYRPLDLTKPRDASLILEATLHACDISNPSRVFPVSSAWTDRITEEFFTQGDLLRRAGLPVLAMHDRNAPLSRAHSQAGFITALVLPLWSLLASPALASVLSVAPVLKNLHANLKVFRDTIVAGESDEKTECV